MPAAASNHAVLGGGEIWLGRLNQIGAPLLAALPAAREGQMRRATILLLIATAFAVGACSTTGQRIGGAAAGAGTGAVIAGPVGAVVGGAAGAITAPTVVRETRRATRGR
jgi:hypothetical protein